MVAKLTPFETIEITCAGMTEGIEAIDQFAKLLRHRRHKGIDATNGTLTNLQIIDYLFIQIGRVESELRSLTEACNEL